MASRPDTKQLRELAFRANNGVAVSLLWRKADGSLVVRVEDERSGDAFDLSVGAHEALEAFEHPYAYAAFHGVAYRTDREAVYA